MTLLRNLLWGARTGLVFGCLFAGLALLVFLIGGQATFAILQTSFEKTVVGYLVGGVCGGVITGLLRPLTSSKPGAGFVGFLSLIPFAILVIWARGHTGPWQPSDIVGMCLVALLGVPLGVTMLDQFPTFPRTRRRQSRKAPDAVD